MLLYVCRHGEGVVDEFIVPGLRRSYAECLGSRPVLAVNDGPEQPLRIGLVGDGQVANLFGTHCGRVLEYLHA